MCWRPETNLSRNSLRNDENLILADNLILFFYNVWKLIQIFFPAKMFNREATKKFYFNGNAIKEPPPPF